MMPWRSLNGSHNGKYQCKKEDEFKRQKLAAKEAREVTPRAFSAYGLPLDMVTSFKYLLRVLSEVDDD